MTDSRDKFDAVIQTPFSALGIVIDNGVIQRIDFTDATPLQPRNALAEKAVSQLETYLSDPEFRFDLPLAAAATSFQTRVRHAMLAIAPGAVKTYGEMARLLMSAPRAIGQACRRNPLPIIVPCHRVVGGSGIGGFSGDASGGRVSYKEWLLRHESD